jgi:hypothetical protein
MNRGIKRHVAQQQMKISQELNALVRNFMQYVGDDLPNPELRGNLLTNKFNMVWVEYCKHWGRINKRALVEPHPKAFLNTVCGMETQEPEIAQTTTTTEHAHVQINAQNENEPNGPGQAENGKETSKATSKKTLSKKG